MINKLLLKKYKTLKNHKHNTLNDVSNFAEIKLPLKK